MSLIELGGGEVALADEWGIVGAQATRVTANQRTGDGAVQSALTVANADGWVYAAGGLVNYNATNAGQGCKLWTCCSFRVSIGAVGGIPYGPIYNASAQAAEPAFFGIKSGNYLALYSAILNELVAGTTVLSLNTHYPLRVLWDDVAHTVTAWLWNGSAWVQELTYSYGSTLWTLATYAYIVWGWKSFKGSGGLSFTAITDDMWANSDQDNGDGCNTAPAEPPSIYGIHPNSDTGITYNEWTASGGGAASYTEWDDDPTDDADTTYNESGTGLAEVKQTSEFEDSILGSDGHPGCGVFLPLPLYGGPQRCS